MKSFIGIVVLLIISANLQAQTIISGIVTDSFHAPIPYASVYLSKTTFGVITNDKGAYTLTIPQDGTFELIVSCVGFKTYSQIIRADGLQKNINIALSERRIMIDEVTIKDKDKNRPQNYSLFKRCFIGRTINSPFCTIGNPKDLIVYRNSQDSNLIAYSVKPLVITNSRLKYEIYYDLKYFNYNLSSRQLIFSGDYYFKDISNQKRKTARVNQYRLSAYNGSRVHFLKALFTDSLRQENFEVCTIGLDSCGDKTLTHSVNEKDLRIALTPDSMALYHFYPILIYYKEIDPRPTYHYYNYPFRTITSRVDFYDTLQVYKYGNYSDPYSVSWSGDMVNRRIAEMLPYDFIPKTLVKKQ